MGSVTHYLEVNATADQCYEVKLTLQDPELPRIPLVFALRSSSEPGDDGSRFHRFSDHRLVRPDDGQRPCRRNAQAVHGFGTEIFADRGAQHRPSVPHARVRRGPRALELDIANPRAAYNFPQRDRAAVAELRHIHAELMSGIYRG